jgi:hypothetical protein
MHGVGCMVYFTLSTDKVLALNCGKPKPKSLAVEKY